MLPDGFHWTRACPSDAEGTSLVYLHSEIARMLQRVDNGAWFAVLRCPDGRESKRNCSTLEAGRAGCEAWVRRHRAALIEAAERKHVAWAATQTWRGAIDRVPGEAR